MSDARQAIAAARVAGASESTSPDLYAAEAAIGRAEQHLEAQEYTRARLAAMEAKHHAGAALAGAQHADGSRADGAHLDGQTSRDVAAPLPPPQQPQ